MRRELLITNAQRVLNTGTLECLAVREVLSLLFQAGITLDDLELADGVRQYLAEIISE